MKIIISLFGKPKDQNILSLTEEYKKRTSRYQDLEFIYFRKYEGLEKFLVEVSGSSRKIFLMSEHGKELSTDEFTKNIYEKNLQEGVKEILFSIGPAEGWGDVLSESKKNMLHGKNISLLSLSKMVMQHDIAFLVLTEQIYRAVSIKNNLPYHKS